MSRKILTVFIGVFFVLMSLPPVSVALTGGPDAGGYVYYDSYEEGVVPFEWDSILNSKNSVVIPEFQSVAKDGGEEAFLSHPVDIGFTFTFYGVEYDKVYVSKYGYLTFSDGPALAACYIEPIPTASRYTTGNFIAGMWAYLHPGA